MKGVEGVEEVVGIVIDRADRRRSDNSMKQ